MVLDQCCIDNHCLFLAQSGTLPVGDDEAPRQGSMHKPLWNACE